MYQFTQLLLLAATAAGYSYTLQAPPKNVTVIPDRMANWSYNSRYWIDGKMHAYLEDPNNQSSNFIIHMTTDFRSRSPDQFVANITAPAGAPSNYPHIPGMGVDTENIAATYPNNGTVLPANQTGLYDDGAAIYQNSKNVTFKNNSWLFNVFRLAQTSQPGAALNKMIGFSHVEWTMGACIYKWVGVRYSDDGLGWTYPVPIITKDTMAHACAPYANATGGPYYVGTGDMAAAWDPVRLRWVILAQEGQLVMSVSNDPLAKPGSWQKINPVTNETRPGLIGGTSTTSLAHPDLSNISGSNPSIIRDTKNSVWRMVYSRWGGNLYASTSTDLSRWSTPTELDLAVGGIKHPGPLYPTFIGTGGDVVTTDGSAMLYFTDALSGGGFKSLWGVRVVFG